MLLFSTSIWAAMQLSAIHYFVVDKWIAASAIEIKPDRPLAVEYVWFRLTFLWNFAESARTLLLISHLLAFTRFSCVQTVAAVNATWDIVKGDKNVKYDHNSLSEHKFKQKLRKFWPEMTMLVIATQDQILKQIVRSKWLVWSCG